MPVGLRPAGNGITDDAAKVITAAANKSNVRDLKVWGMPVETV